MADATSEASSLRIGGRSGWTIERPLALAVAVVAVALAVIALAPVTDLWQDIKTGARFLYLIAVIIS